MTSRTVEDFFHGEDGLLQRIKAQQYARALDMIITEGHQFPKFSRGLTHRRICLAVVVKDVNQAQQLLEEALAGNNFYPASVFGPEGQTPGGVSLWDVPELAPLVVRHQERYQAAMDATPPVLVKEAPDSTSDKLPPLLLALHGNNSTVAEEIDFYRPITKAGVLLAMPQSAEPWIANAYGWIDWTQTVRQLQRDFDLLRQQAQFDPDRVVIAGFSLGGDVALRMAMNQVLPVRGFIAFAPGGPCVSQPEKLQALFEAGKGKGMRGYVMMGEADPSYEWTQRLIQALKDFSVPHKVEFYPGLGHAYPPNFADSLLRALDFIL